ncbi:hypothetical protein NCCP2222_10960 [Sporosarcina sp. NCCP-2222]|uniref:hypothetical protein n=1 Tax=Sporosarcina sp. NCCP-2222 TaxID=2935073 RepID=UPI00208A1582|nr:hypothetical protein [Sporosarcina sp. NCCP-2222]GKV55149.1 hypothetical protein NCCP2222_10960 [Sporosarcina sp. NCCP-2222]
MEDNRISKRGHPNALSAWKRMYYYAVIAGLSIFAIFIFTVFWDLFLTQEWFLAIIFGGLFLFLCWIIIMILRAPRTSGVTKLEQIDTRTGYIIHAENEWTGEKETISFYWDQVDALLIGIWTNPGFKERKYDYVGARLVYRYNEAGVKKYADHIIVCEKKLDEWVDKIRKHAIPCRVTNANISAVKKEEFDEMLTEVTAVPISEIPSIRDWFMEQEDFTLWHPSTRPQKK